jgi:hypothetical protein
MMNRHAVALALAVTLLGLNFRSSRLTIRNLSVTSVASTYSDELSAIQAAAVMNGGDAADVAGDRTMATTTSQTTMTTASSLRAAAATRNGLKDEKIAENEPAADKEERPQPHTGARDAAGRLGYVADVTRVRRWMWERYATETTTSKTTTGGAREDHGMVVPPPPHWTPTPYSTHSPIDPCGALRYSDAGTRALLKIVPDHPGVPPYPDHNTSFVPPFTNRSEEYERYNVATASRPYSPHNNNPRLLCAIYTYAGKHEQVTAVQETWGYKCDGFLAASTLTVEDRAQFGYGAVNLTHYGPEHYGNMWQKTRSILAYLHDHYRHDYDYFWVGGDDTFMVVENMKRYLAIVEDRYGDAARNEPLYLGHHVRAPSFRFAGGGPGYILNRRALEIFFEQASQCQEYTEVSAEDRYLGMCYKTIGVLVQDTADARGQQRFIGYEPNIMGKTDGMAKFFRRLFQLWIDDHPRTSMGQGLISEQAFGLHWFKTPELLHHVHAILYRTCPADSVVGKFVLANDPNRTSTVVSAGALPTTPIEASPVAAAAARATR